jgi:hypothetical protein
VSDKCGLHKADQAQVTARNLKPLLQHSCKPIVVM